MYLNFFTSKLFLFDFSYLLMEEQRTEPKHIVLLSQLLQLFKFCHSCKADHPKVIASEVDTEVIVKTICSNVDCQKAITWRSEIYLPKSKVSTCNFLLCYATILAGGSPTKMLRICHHMGLRSISLNTFFRYQRVYSTVILSTFLSVSNYTGKVTKLLNWRN